MLGHEKFAATSIRQPGRRGWWGGEVGPPVGPSTSAMPNVIRNSGRESKNLRLIRFESLITIS